MFIVFLTRASEMKWENLNTQKKLIQCKVWIFKHLNYVVLIKNTTCVIYLDCFIIKPDSFYSFSKIWLTKFARATQNFKARDCR